MGTLQIGLVVGAALGSSVGSTFRSLDKNIMNLTKKASFAKDGLKIGETFKTMRAEALKMSSIMQRGLLDDGGIRKFAQLREATRAASSEVRKYGLDIGNLNKQLSTMRTYSIHQQGFSERAEMRALRRTERGGMMGDLLGTVAIGTAAFAYPMKVGMSFQKTMSNVQAISGATDEEMKRLKEQAKERGKNSIFSGTQVGEAQGFLSLAGFKPLETESAIPGVLNLAAAGGLDMGRAAEINAVTLKSFKLAAEESDRVADAIALTSTTSNTTVEGIGESLKYSAGISSALNVSLEKNLALLGALGDRGIKDSMAGTVVRGMYDSLVDASNVKKLNEFGVKTTNKDGTLRDLDQVIIDWNNLMDKKGFGQAEKTSAIMDIFGVRAGTGASTTWEEITSGRVKAYEERLIKESQGTAAKMAKTKTDNLWGAFVELGSAFESVGTEIQETYEKDLEGFVRGMSSSVRSASDFISQNKALTKSVVGLGAGLLGLKIASLGTRLSWSYLKDGGSVLMDGFQHLRPSVIKNSIEMAKLAGNGSILKGAFSNLGGGIRSFRHGFMEDFRVIKNSPLTAKLLGITAVGFALTVLGADWGAFIDEWESGWNRAKAAMEKGEVFDSAVNVLAGVTSGALQTLKPIAENMQKVAVVNGYDSGRDQEARQNAALEAQERIDRGEFRPGDWEIAGLAPASVVSYTAPAPDINVKTEVTAKGVGKIQPSSITTGFLGASMPKFATGGLVTKPTFSLIGEAGPEVVVPIGSSFRNQGRSLLGYAAGALGFSGGTPSDSNLDDIFSSKQHTQSAGLTIQGGIHIHASPGMNVQELADEVIRKIKYAAGVRERSAYADASFFG